MNFLRHTLNDRSISRSEFLRTAVLLGLSATRAYGGTTGYNRMTVGIQAEDTAKRWSDTAIATLRTLQENAYKDLGIRLGWPDSPVGVYQRLTKGRVPIEFLNSRKFEEMYGVKLTEVDRADLDTIIRDYVRRYVNAPLPTEYEDPNWYAVLLEMSDDIERFAKSVDRTVQRHPLFGSLPTGSVNARTIPVPQTKEYVVVFHHGLFMFADQMAELAAQDFPPLLSDGNSLRFVRERLSLGDLMTLGLDAFDQFNRILYAYIVQGNPREVPRLSTANSGAARAVLVRGMELFSLAHEYGHVVHRHAEEAKASNGFANGSVEWYAPAEQEADIFGLNALTHLESPGVIYSYWGADYMFTCLSMIERCLSTLRHGAPNTDQSWRSEIVDRREQLRVQFRSLYPKEADSAINLGKHIQSQLEGLWSRSSGKWIRFYEQGIRPSPIWQ